MNFAQITKEVLEIEANELLRASNSFGDEISRAVELMSNTSSKIVITGMGKSGHIGAKIAATLASTGTPSFFLHPAEAMHGDLGMIRSGDTMFLISYSGESEEILNILPHIRRFDIPIISMSSNPNSTLAKNSDVHLCIKVDVEACPLRSAPTSSTTLTLALGDALAVCLMKKKNFKVEDFASFHPGGSLGKKLFVKVNNIAKSKNLPVISENTSVKDALVSITEGRIGNVIIVDNKNKVLAILSDGDLRRALLRKDFSLDEKAINYATKDPKILTDDNVLASKALAMIEELKIQLLIITDQKKILKSVVHIHDLIEAGIK
ncbi:MAG: Arabinose 5-phosphate isomerase (EC [uncultured Campylobacterales bacterium]|uniref:Arabinose 5-phosphate isomerase (EC) n=1 Tax=uncultured Campylobacterales bacterium TaxID=352960 RepID=A0A6S6S8P3_9BACT|nr:MAG: Arabinose 5-phosphate isomerase (EC [uncultured Campylobacterales bacterium]